MTDSERLSDSRIVVRVSPDLKEWLKGFSEDIHMSVSELVREYLMHLRYVHSGHDVEDGVQQL